MNFTVAKVVLCMEVRKRPVVLFYREYDFCLSCIERISEWFSLAETQTQLYLLFFSSDAANRGNAQKH